MVKGEKKDRRPVITAPPTQNYRSIEALNQSMIALFDESPVQFFKEYILGEPREEEESSSLLIGTLVDEILLTHRGDFQAFEDGFDEKFAVYTGKKSDAQAFILADELFRLTMRDMEDGVIVSEFPNRFREAFDIVQEQGKYKNKTVEQGLADFEKPNKAGDSGESYFKTKLDNIGKMVVSIGLVERAKEIASELLTCDWTKEIYAEKDVMEDFRKLPITFTYIDPFTKEEIEGKLELDQMLVDYEEHTLQPIDLKTAFDNSQWPYSYRKWRYYLQQAWYTLGINAWKKANNMEKFETRPFKFIVADTSVNKRLPLIFQLNSTHLDQGLNGFSYNGKKHRGIIELVADIMWASKNGQWGISRENFNNKGIVSLENFS